MSDLVEIFQKALQNEVKARAFYRLASELTQNDETRPGTPSGFAWQMKFSPGTTSTLA